MMEPVSASASPLVLLLAWSVVLLVAHVLLQGMFATKELGTDWNAGPRDDDKQPASMEGICFDVTERRQAEARLADSAEASPSRIAVSSSRTRRSPRRTASAA